MPPVYFMFLPVQAITCIFLQKAITCIFPQKAITCILFPQKDIMDYINDNSCTIKKRQKALTSYSYNLWLLKENLQLHQETVVDKNRFSKDVRNVLSFFLSCPIHLILTSTSHTSYSHHILITHQRLLYLYSPLHPIPRTLTIYSLLTNTC